MNLVIRIYVISILLLSFVHIQSRADLTAATGSSKKNQLEDLFIWKVSEELKLSTIEDKKFSEAWKKLSSKKQMLSEKLEISARDFIHAQNDSDRKSKLNIYKKTLQDYNQVSVEEIDQMVSIFGARKFARYLEVKMSLTSKVKNLIIAPEKVKEKKPLPPPQVIEE